MDKKTQGYSVISYNIKDNAGQFTYKVKLSDHISIDPDTGYLHCYDAIVGNVGVQTYSGSELGFADGNRIVKVHRKAEYIFAEDSLESLEGKPITLTHPKENVNSKNIKKYGMGTILDTGRKNGDNILCNLVIQDAELIDKIYPESENGDRTISDEFRDLSLGYSAKLLPFEDTDEYVQTDIRYNHLAVVREGRASNAMIVDSKNKEIKEKKSMKLFDFLKGKRIKTHDDDSFTILADEETIVHKETVVVESEHKDPYDKDKIIKVEKKITEVVTEEDSGDKKIEANEEEKIMKDQKYFDQEFKDAMGLPEGPYKADKIQTLNDEYLELFPRKEIIDEKPKPSVLKDIKIVDSKTINGAEIKDEQPEKKIDFAYMEKESKNYYDKLTNPESGAHVDHKAWKSFYGSEQRSGKVNLNL